MSGDCTLPNDQLCGCCDGVVQETPQLITNRPALPEIAYRVGTHSTFNASMLASLSDPAYPALAMLRTRDTSDFSIALLDSWAVALDILTFYQERFANEAFLRTAVDQRSVFELARLVGYVPSPGVAASAVLAFTLSSAPGAPDNVLIPASTRVQSIPGPGQSPQTFETSADLTAVIGCNALPASTEIPWQLFGSDVSTWISGTANAINVGDALLFVAANAGVPVPTGAADVRYVTAVTIDSNAGNTRIAWDSPLSSFGSGTNAQAVCIYVFRKKAALYGAQAANPMTLTGTNIQNVIGYPTGTFSSGTDWNFQYTEYSNQIHLDASYPGLVPQQNGTPQWIILTGDGYTSFFQITNAVDSNPAYYALNTKTTQLTLALGRILTGDPALTLNEVLWEFVRETRNITAYIQSAALTPANLPNTHWNALTTYHLASGMIVPVQGTSVSVVGGQQLAPGQPVGISGQRVRLQVQPNAGAVFTPSGSSASLAVADDQIFLVAGYPPTLDPKSGNLLWDVITTSNIFGALLIGSDYIEFLPADKSDPVAGEAAMVSDVSVSGDVTTLSLQSPLLGIYDAPSVAVNANAVLSTHGETVQEILGSGDSTNSQLQFTLKQSPLTYVSSPTSSGVQSTLQVWVNNLRWQEVGNLLASGPADRAFVTFPGPSGNVAVRFGNGTQGELTPTGTSNIRAVYRKGIGTAGMVSAGQLSQPLDRPQGLKSVTNPSPATGAADPATADEARARTPMQTLTIGRVVSLEDYQNYALAYPGIAKAIATWTWFGNTRGVFLTVAGPDGATFQTDDPILTNFILSVRSISNPFVPLQVASFVPLLFQFSAQVKIDQTDYDSAQVLAQVWQNLLNAFAFDQRQLAQNVAASELIEVIQQTPGVIALRLQSLNLSGEPPDSPPPMMLCASGPMPPAGVSLLLLDPATVGNIGIWS